MDEPRVYHTQWSKAEREKYHKAPMAQWVKNVPAMWRHRFDSCVRKILWSRKWQPIPILLPGKFHEQRSLKGYTVHWVTKSQTRLSTWHYTHIWNLEKWCWWAYLQGRNRDTDIEDRHGHSEGRREWDELREQHGNIYTTICETDS